MQARSSNFHNICNIAEKGSMHRGKIRRIILVVPIMIASRLRKCLFNATGLGAGILLALTTLAQATTFSSLGVAQDFGLLTLSGGINQSGNGSGNTVQGNIGVAAAFSGYNGSGTLNDPSNFDILTTSTFLDSANGVKGTLNQNLATNLLLLNASTAATTTSAWATALGLLPTASYGTLLNSTTISEKTAGEYVFDLAGINLAGGTLTLSAPVGSTFILDIGGAFNLASANIVLSGGLTANDVLFNVTGSGAVNLSGGTNPSTVNGIILALYRSVNMAGGLVNGEVIAGGANLSSGASIKDLPAVMTPETNTGLVLIPFVGAVLLFSARRFLPQTRQGRKNHA